MGYLQVENLQKQFGNTEVLRKISFSLGKGEILAIIGSSGSGKTTLLRCLNFLERADSGTISVGGATLFDGAEQAAYSEAQMRERRLHFGLVFQSFNLFPQYTARQNIMLAQTLPAYANRRRILHKNFRTRMGNLFRKLFGKAQKALLPAPPSKKQIAADAQSRADALLARVGLSDRASNYPCQLSGGQQQRVAIARALALQPDILCFDEPTSALDPELTGEVLKVIRSLKDGDSTMVVVTHEMEFARTVADRILFLADGKIEESGTPEEVFGNPKSPKTKAFLSRTKF